MHAKLLHLCLTLGQWTVAHQALLSVGFSRQGWWSGLSCSPLRGSSWPRDQTQVSYIFCTFRQVLDHYHHQISNIHTISFCHISMSYVLLCLLVCVFDCAYMYLSVLNPLILWCDGKRVCALIKLNLSFTNFLWFFFLLYYPMNHCQVCENPKVYHDVYNSLFPGFYFYSFFNMYSFHFCLKILDFPMAIWLWTWLALYLQFIWKYYSDLMRR